jgi:hypothetical protein
MIKTKRGKAKIQFTQSVMTVIASTKSKNKISQLKIRLTVKQEILSVYKKSLWRNLLSLKQKNRVERGRKLRCHTVHAIVSQQLRRVTASESFTAI